MKMNLDMKVWDPDLFLINMSKKSERCSFVLNKIMIYKLRWNEWFCFTVMRFFLFKKNSYICIIKMEIKLLLLS